MLPTTLLHAKDSSSLLQVTGRHFLNLKVFLLWIQLICYRLFPDICIHSNDSPFLHPYASSHSQLRDCNHERESFRFNLCESGIFYFSSSPLFFIHGHNCIFYSECCKEMLLFLVYPSLDRVKDDFKITGYIKALLSHEHNKTVN